MTTGELIKKELKKRGLTISEASRQSKIDRSVLSNLANDNKAISIASAMLLERGLAFEAEELVGLQIKELRRRGGR